MTKPHALGFKCQSCSNEISFSLFENDSLSDLTCMNCNKKYAFDKDLTRQLKKFQDLCLQIRESEEILGTTSFGIDVGDKNVKIPFKLLLTRLNSFIDLKIGDANQGFETLTITFRCEPLHDLPKKMENYAK